MIFKAIQGKFKAKSGFKYLENELSKSRFFSNCKKGVSSIGCIIDTNIFPNHEAFNELITDFGLPPNGVKIIGYKKDNITNSIFGVQFCTDKDLGWNGAIESRFVSEFFDKEYDVLINYYTNDKLMLKLMTARTKARIKVGFVSVDTRLNDLIFDIPITNFKVFKTELTKYLKVLNEIM